MKKIHGIPTFESAAGKIVKIGRDIPGIYLDLMYKEETDINFFIDCMRTYLEKVDGFDHARSPFGEGEMPMSQIHRNLGCLLSFKIRALDGTEGYKYQLTLETSKNQETHEVVINFGKTETEDQEVSEGVASMAAFKRKSTSEFKIVSGQEILTETTGGRPPTILETDGQFREFLKDIFEFGLNCVSDQLRHEYLASRESIAPAYAEALSEVVLDTRKRVDIADAALIGIVVGGVVKIIEPMPEHNALIPMVTTIVVGAIRFLYLRYDIFARFRNTGAI